MTVVFAAASWEFCVLANDSCVVREFADGTQEYDTGGKSFAESRAGVVTMWGARDGNGLIGHLRDLRGSQAQPQAIDLLARGVHRYLTDTYDPHSRGLPDTGYHIAGFTAAGAPRLYHSFYNAAGGPAAFESRGAYSFQDQSPDRNKISFLYNGRNDLVDAPLNLLIAELNRGKPVRFPLTPDGVGRLAHFVLRVARELSFDVAPPFLVHLIAPNGRCHTCRVDDLGPLPDGYFNPAWQNLVQVSA